MKQRKGLYKALSLLLIICFLLQPAYHINTRAANDVILNLADGVITLNGHDYVQKTVSGTVVNEGTIDNEGRLILTGSQNNSWKVDVNGSDIPIIQYKNCSTNAGVDLLDVVGDINIEFEGNVSLNGQFIFYNTSNTGIVPNPNITSINMTGMFGSTVTINSSGGLLADDDYSYHLIGLNIINSTFPANISK